MSPKKAFTNVTIPKIHLSSLGNFDLRPMVSITATKTNCIAKAKNINGNSENNRIIIFY
jgi:hypothetical protein